MTASELEGLADLARTFVWVSTGILVLMAAAYVLFLVSKYYW